MQKGVRLNINLNQMVIKKLSIFFFAFFSFCLNNEQSYQIAIAAKIAYYSRENIIKWQCKQCDHMTTDINFVSNQQAKVQGFIGYSHYLKSIIISIRGSTNSRNWFSNFDISLTSYPYCDGCSVHKGFYQLSQLLYNPIKQRIQKISKKYKQVGTNFSITFTGHSLGGAISTLIGSRLIYSEGITGKLITFGSPRIGNKAFANFISSNFKESNRIVYGRDSIPHLPIRLIGYVHADREIWYEFTDKKKQCLGDKSKQCSNSVSPFLLKSSHHSMDRYVKLFYNSLKYIAYDFTLKSTLLDTKITDDAILQDIKLQQSPYKSQTQGLQGYQLIKILSKDIPLEDIIQKYDG